MILPWIEAKWLMAGIMFTLAAFLFIRALKIEEGK